jgi:hypothetical protein
MKKLILLLVMAVFLVGCASESIEQDTRRDDFDIDTCTWTFKVHTYLWVEQNWWDGFGGTILDSWSAYDLPEKNIESTKASQHKKAEALLAKYRECKD